MKIFAFLLIFIPSICFSATYYVDFDTGNDTNSGTTESPLKYAPDMQVFGGTIQLTSGDTVVFKGGVVWLFPVYTSNRWSVDTTNVTYTSDKTWYSGSAWSPPQFTADGAVVGTDAPFVVVYSDGNVFENLKFGPFNIPDNPRNGGKPMVIRGASSLTVRNCEFSPIAHHSIVAVGGYGPVDNLTIENNIFTSVANSIEIPILMHVRNLVIRDNVFKDMSIMARDDHIDGIQMWGNTTSDDTKYNIEGDLTARIYNNYFIGDWSANDPAQNRALNACVFVQAHEFDTGFIMDVKIYNNFIHMNFDNSLNEPDADDVAAVFYVGDNAQIWNNTVIVNSGDNYLTIVRTEGAPQVKINNNLFFAGGNKIYWETQMTDPPIVGDINNNVIYNYGSSVANWHGQFRDLEWWTSNGYDLNSPTTEPLLDSNFKPIEGSNVIDAGVDLSQYFNADLDGNIRTPPWDIGAYEYTGQAPPDQGLQHPWSEVDQMTTDVKDRTPIDTTRFAPPGGTTGQVLTKLSDTDYDVAWQDYPAGEACIIGLNGTGNLESPAANNVNVALKATGTCDGSLVTAHVYQYAEQTAAVQMKLCIYTDTDPADDRPYNSDVLIACTDAIELTPGGIGWHDTTFSGAITDGGHYWLMMLPNPANAESLQWGADDTLPAEAATFNNSDLFTTPPTNPPNGWNPVSSSTKTFYFSE